MYWGIVEFPEKRDLKKSEVVVVFDIPFVVYTYLMYFTFYFTASTPIKVVEKLTEFWIDVFRESHYANRKFGFSKKFDGSIHTV